MTVDEKTRRDVERTAKRDELDRTWSASHPPRHPKTADEREMIVGPIKTRRITISTGNGSTTYGCHVEGDLIVDDRPVEDWEWDANDQHSEIQWAKCVLA